MSNTPTAAPPEIPPIDDDDDDESLVTWVEGVYGSTTTAICDPARADPWLHKEVDTPDESLPGAACNDELRVAAASLLVRMIWESIETDDDPPIKIRWDCRRRPGKESPANWGWR